MLSSSSAVTCQAVVEDVLLQEVPVFGVCAAPVDAGAALQIQPPGAGRQEQAEQRCRKPEGVASIHNHGSLMSKTGLPREY